MQEGDDALFEFAGREREGGVEREGVGHVPLAGSDAAQRGEVRATAELRAEFVRERADVGALGAGDAELRERLRVGGEAVVEDVHETRLADDFDSLAREFVERDSALFLCGNHRRDLLQVADKRGGSLVQLVERERRDGKRGGDFAVHVVAVRGFAEFDVALIDLVVGHQLLGQLRATAQHDDEQAGGVGVERAAVADLSDVELAADGIHHVVGGAAHGLVHEEGTVERIKLEHENSDERTPLTSRRPKLS